MNVRPVQGYWSVQTGYPRVHWRQAKRGANLTVPLDPPGFEDLSPYAWLIRKLPRIPVGQPNVTNNLCNCHYQFSQVRDLARGRIPYF